MNRILLAVVANCFMLRIRIARKYVHQTLNKINTSRNRGNENASHVRIKNIKNGKITFEKIGKIILAVVVVASKYTSQFVLKFAANNYLSI